ncbi:hypothetical protein Hanom_Chr11g00999021 [Helianthus anomalus]
MYFDTLHTRSDQSHLKLTTLTTILSPCTRRHQIPIHPSKKQRSISLFKPILITVILEQALNRSVHVRAQRVRAEPSHGEPRLPFRQYFMPLFPLNPLTRQNVNYFTSKTVLLNADSIFVISR